MLFKKDPLDPSMGLCYLAEQSTPEGMEIANVQEHRKGEVFFLSFDACLHSFDVINRNKRQYKRKNIEECLQQEKIQTLLKGNRWYGEDDHPRQDYKNAPLTPERIQAVEHGNRTHKITKPIFNGNLLLATIETASGTEKGRGFANDIIQGEIPAFSCRAIAQLQMIDNRPTVVVRRVITYDRVLYQSHREAEMVSPAVGKTKSIVTESTNDFVESPQDILLPLHEILVAVGNKDYNTQCVLESFDLSMNDLEGFSDDHRQIIMRDGQSKMFVNMNKESKKMVDDFFSSF